MRGDDSIKMPSPHLSTTLTSHKLLWPRSQELLRNRSGIPLFSLSGSNREVCFAALTLGETSKTRDYYATLAELSTRDDAKILSKSIPIWKIEIFHHQHSRLCALICFFFSWVTHTQTHTHVRNFFCPLPDCSPHTAMMRVFCLFLWADFRERREKLHFLLPVPFRSILLAESHCTRTRTHTHSSFCCRLLCVVRFVKKFYSLHHRCWGHFSL